MDSALRKILLVEDDPFLSSLLKNRLQKEGFDITLAKDGQECIDQLKIIQPDLMLLDLILPKKTGFEVMEEIRLDPQFYGKNVPIIVISIWDSGKIFQKAGNWEQLIITSRRKFPLTNLSRKSKNF